MTKQEIEERLAKLRNEWKVDPAKRKIIESQARALKIALEMLENKDSFEIAKKIFTK